MSDLEENKSGQDDPEHLAHWAYKTQEWERQEADRTNAYRRGAYEKHQRHRDAVPSNHLGVTAQQWLDAALSDGTHSEILQEIIN